MSVFSTIPAIFHSLMCFSSVIHFISDPFSFSESICNFTYFLDQLVSFSEALTVLAGMDRYNSKFQCDVQIAKKKKKL